ncbi:MAG: FAD-dependent oxidoreductase [Clostridia bacterium]
MKAKYEKYDVVIIGGGIGGLMTAYRLTQHSPESKVLIIEKGNELKNRICPIIAKKSNKCLLCKDCAIMKGIAGAGAFSDGKYVISTEYGGWLTDFMPPEEVIKYIEQADSILVKYGATTDRYMPNNDLKLICLQHDLHMQQAQLKHLGTDENFDTMLKFTDDLATRVEILTLTEVTDVDKNINLVKYKDKNGEYTVNATNIIFAVGRAGSSFFSNWCKANGQKLSNNQVDVGVRVELPRLIWEHFSKFIYEPKIWYRSRNYADITRMFCFNEGGNVVIENTDGILTVNGHAYRDNAKKSQNSNFALLTTTRFTEPFKEPIEYAKYVASLANKISGGTVLVQRFGDLIKGRRTNDERLKSSTTRPTLNAVPGDLSLCMPKRQLDNIIETLYALDKIAPGTANDDTLLYGVECKYYSSRPDANNFMLANTKNIYAVGDGAGFTRSLSQAAANGLYVADIINGNEK